MPWKGYFDIINSVDEFVIYDDVQFTKNDWRNRNQIMTPQGKSWLTVPVKHQTGQLIYEVEVSDPEWQSKHWERLKQNYSKAPFFKDFREPFESFYRGEKIHNLSLANLKLISAVNITLGISTNISDSRQYRRDLAPSERLLTILKSLGGTEYLSGPAAKSYLDESIFIEEGIKVSFMNYENYPTYSQLSQEFAHDVTILDVLFNCGPEARAQLKSFTL
ncbi:MAG: WbqC family protein [Aurantimicrobium sp.]|uniref:WbqC family protein n=1 Tax=Aurantimicrobium sp. TaxID=1930784 RepID=UPI002FC86BD2